MKRKLFLYKYNDCDYYWICYSKIDGGWVDYNTVQLKRKARKQTKKIKRKKRYEQYEEALNAAYEKQ